ncbi:hypothetical protein Tco_1247616 [Tanacetum coccineum]
MADDQPMWENNQAVAPTLRAAIVAVDLGDNFTVKGHHLSMIKDRQFDEHSPADPHKHIAEFVEVCGMFRYGNTNADAIKLKLFPSSLAGEAKIWFNEISPGVITTWEEMRQDVLSFRIEKRLMRSDELHKFSDDTLQSVWYSLHDTANNLRMGYNKVMPRRIWSNLDKKRSHIIVKDIDRQLQERRLMRSLEKFVGGREYGNDLKLIQRTI